MGDLHRGRGALQRLRVEKFQDLKFHKACNAMKLFYHPSIHSVLDLVVFHENSNHVKLGF